MADLKAEPKIHKYIIEIYKNCDDRYYVNRFIRYLVLLKMREPNLSLKEHNLRIRILIDGSLSIKKSTKLYNTLEDCVNNICNNSKEFKPYEDRDISILSKIYTSTKYRLIDTLSIISESEILRFIDQSYRTYCLHTSLSSVIDKKILDETKFVQINKWFTKSDNNFKVYIRSYNNSNDVFSIEWNNEKYVVKKENITSNIKCDNPLKQYEILDAYEM
jgi:hypothetical protein